MAFIDRNFRAATEEISASLVNRKPVPDLAKALEDDLEEDVLDLLETLGTLHLEDLRLCLSGATKRIGPRLTTRMLLERTLAGLAGESVVPTCARYPQPASARCWRLPPVQAFREWLESRGFDVIEDAVSI